MQETENVIAIGVASSSLLGSNAARRKIICTPMLAGNYTVSSITPAILGQGVQVFAGGPPVIIDDEQYGKFTTLPLFVIGSAAGNANIIIVTNTAG
jgi:hypothetical protein